jgi:hypothetical protein
MTDGPTAVDPLQSVVVTRSGWLIVVAAVLAVASATVHFWKVQKPPAPSGAALPESARMRLQPFHLQPIRKDGIDLKVDAHGELQYRIAMQAGATLVYSWTASRGAVSYQFADQNPGRATDAHGAFVAQSSGWYRWRWTNTAGNTVTIHLKLNGYYEPAGIPYDR